MFSRTPPRPVFVYNQTRETFLAFRVKVADSVIGRLVGLLGKRFLKPGSGVWIVPANSVHSIGMLFTFDLVLIDKDFKVVGLRELVRPFKITRPNFRAESVIELPAHTIFKSRTEIGDTLVIERYEAKNEDAGAELATRELALRGSVTADEPAIASPLADSPLSTSTSTPQASADSYPSLPKLPAPFVRPANKGTDISSHPGAAGSA